MDHTYIQLYTMTSQRSPTVAEEATYCKLEGHLVKFKRWKKWIPIYNLRGVMGTLHMESGIIFVCS